MSYVKWNLCHTSSFGGCYVLPEPSVTDADDGGIFDDDGISSHMLIGFNTVYQEQLFCVIPTCE